MVRFALAADQVLLWQGIYFIDRHREWGVGEKKTNGPTVKPCIAILCLISMR